jgi:hypothetical protein
MGKVLFEEVICRYGIVEQIVTDNGELNSAIGLHFSKKYGFKLTTTTSYHPEGDAVVERGHRSVREPIEKALLMDLKDTATIEEAKGKWSNYFYSARWADRVTVRRTTGYHLIG